MLERGDIFPKTGGPWVIDIRSQEDLTEVTNLRSENKEEWNWRARVKNDRLNLRYRMKNDNTT
jgi:hypothetical protein